MSLTPGIDILHALDRQIAKSRAEVKKASQLPERAAGALLDLRRRQTEAYEQIASDRLDLIFEGGDGGELGYADRQARRLLDTHESSETEAEGKLDAITGELEALEAKRRAAEKDVSRAVTAYDKAVANAELELLEEPSYRAKVAEIEALRSQIERAGAKLEVARADREEKGAAYEADPLFRYLRDRNYGTKAAKGGFLTKFLDGLVARHIGYRRAGNTYRRLLEIPERLEDIDAEIARTEDAHEAARTLVAALQSGEAGPKREAIKLLTKVLTTQSRTELRHLAAQTPTLDDDRAVEELRDLAKLEASLEEDHREAVAIARRYETSLHELEHVRRRFKSRRFESPNSAFKRADLLLSLIRETSSGAETGKGLWKQIVRHQRTVQRYSDPGFGGVVWDDALGLPRSPRYGGGRMPRRRVGGPIIIGGGIFGPGGFGGGGSSGGFGGGFGGGGGGFGGGFGGGGGGFGGGFGG